MKEKLWFLRDIFPNLDPHNDSLELEMSRLVMLSELGLDEDFCQKKSSIKANRNDKKRNCLFPQFSTKSNINI